VNKIPDHFLILFPKNPAWAPANLVSLAAALKAIGLVGVERGPDLFTTGPEYLNLITYLGCSPQIALGENENATTIHLSGVFSTPQFLHGDNLKSPRCPQCRETPVKRDFMPAAGKNLRCQHCGYVGLPHTFDWRRSAAFCRVFIEISNVFESEAVPGEELTDCLAQATGEVWDYSYVRKDFR
jgi:predicted RNA-binding Zn-ribbon protein involved in translation (DUF1610 family)